MSEPQVVFQPRGVYVAGSYMSQIGKYNGKHLDALTFVELAERVGQIFDHSPVRPEDIEAVVVGSQNPIAFNHLEDSERWARRFLEGYNQKLSEKVNIPETSCCVGSTKIHSKQRSRV